MFKIKTLRGDGYKEKRKNEVTKIKQVKKKIKSEKKDK